MREGFELLLLIVVTATVGAIATGTCHAVYTAIKGFFTKDYRDEDTD